MIQLYLQTIFHSGGFLLFRVQIGLAQGLICDQLHHVSWVNRPLLGQYFKFLLSFLLPRQQVIIKHLFTGLMLFLIILSFRLCALIPLFILLMVLHGKILLYLTLLLAIT
jgi:hypothetical protein